MVPWFFLKFFFFLIVWWRHRILGLLLSVYSKRLNFGFSCSRLSFGFLYYSAIRSDSVWYCCVPDFCLHVSVWPCAVVHGSHCQLCMLSSGLLWFFWILAFLQRVECDSKMTEWWLTSPQVSIRLRRTFNGSRQLSTPRCFQKLLPQQGRRDMCLLWLLLTFSCYYRLTGSEHKHSHAEAQAHTINT